jgi:hypothetical protein
LHEIPIALRILSAEESSQAAPVTSVSRLALNASRLHPPSHPNLLTLFRFAMTLAMNTAEAERSFSTVKRMLTDYRRSMTHDRLRNLSVLSHEKILLKSIPIDEFLLAFKTQFNRRLLI